MELVNMWLRNALDYLANTNSGLGVSVVLVVMTIILFIHLTVIQAKETATVRDFLTRYRIYILIFFTTFLVTLIPVGYYLTLRYFGHDSPDLRNLATVSGRFGGLAIAVALEVIYFYRRRREGDDNPSLFTKAYNKVKQLIKQLIAWLRSDENTK